MNLKDKLEHDLEGKGITVLLTPPGCNDPRPGSCRSKDSDPRATGFRSQLWQFIQSPTAGLQKNEQGNLAIKALLDLCSYVLIGDVWKVT